MMRVAASLAIPLALLAGIALAQPNPSWTVPPCPTPSAPHDGPTLQIAFTGLFILRQENTPAPAYKVLMLDLASKSHLPYIRYPALAYKATGFPRSSKYKCDKTPTEYVSLGVDGLKLEPSDAVLDSTLCDGGALDRLVHLQALAGTNATFDETYDQDRPQKGKVTAQFEVVKGSLFPANDPTKPPLVWEFKTESKTSGVRLCGTSGIILSLRLKKNIGTVTLVSVADPKRFLTLTVPDGVETEIVVGNSLKKDRDCQGDPTPKPDKHFVHLYNAVMNPHDKFIPYPIGDCAKVNTESLRGSNCLGGQWP